MAINRPHPPPPVKLFIGSSSEGMQVAEDLEYALGSAVHPIRWDVDAFDPGSFTLESLLDVASEVDFAVLIATPDDTTTKRGATSAVARDNIILEFGLFTGALGRERCFILAAEKPGPKIDLPSDLLGLTRLPYRNDVGGGRQAVSQAVYKVKQAVAKHGRRDSPITSNAPPSVLPPPQALTSGRDPAIEAEFLAREIGTLERDAVAQGWALKTNTDTTLRLKSPRGHTFALAKSTPERTREDLRTFVRELRGHGLRTTTALRKPVEEAPW